MIVSPVVARVFEHQQLDTEDEKDEEEDGGTHAGRQIGDAPAGLVGEEGVQPEEARDANRKLERVANAVAPRKVCEQVARDLSTVEGVDGEQVQQGPVKVDQE